jgi:hypothetical protein
MVYPKMTDAKWQFCLPAHGKKLVWEQVSQVEFLLTNYLPKLTIHPSMFTFIQLPVILSA